MMLYAAFMHSFKASKRLGATNPPASRPPKRQPARLPTGRRELVVAVASAARSQSHLGCSEVRCFRVGFFQWVVLVLLMLFFVSCFCSMVFFVSFVGFNVFFYCLKAF